VGIGVWALACLGFRWDPPRVWALACLGVRWDPGWDRPPHETGVLAHEQGTAGRLGARSPPIVK